MLKAALFSLAVATNNVETVHQTPFFKVVNKNNSAQVFPLDSELSVKLWSKACRKALFYPLGKNNQEQLAKQLNLPLPDTISYVTSKLTHYKEEKIDGGLSCSGNIKETNAERNKAILALTNAWWAFSKNKSKFLKPLLRISMANSATTNDSIALIAIHTKGNKGLKILETQVNSEKLLLNESKIEVANFWFERGKYQRSIKVLYNCKTDQCENLKKKAKLKKELKDNEGDDSLSRYFT